jgi:hypothetical protein
MDQDVAGIGGLGLLQMHFEALAHADLRMVNYDYADRQQDIVAGIQATGFDVDHAPSLFLQRTLEIVVFPGQSVEARLDVGVQVWSLTSGEGPDHRS